MLVPRLLDRGYRVRVLDRLYFGEEPLAGFRDRVELVVADVRDIPATALDGVDGVINLSGLSNDPTAEFDPRANWQMNAIATETLGRMCVERGVERYVFASSCSLYDGMAPGMHAMLQAGARRSFCSCRALGWGQNPAGASSSSRKNTASPAFPSESTMQSQCRTCRAN